MSSPRVSQRPHMALPETLSSQHSRRLQSPTADRGWVIWGRDIQLQPSGSPPRCTTCFLPLAPNFLWDSARKAKVREQASTQCIHGEIIIFVCFKHLREPSLNYFSGNGSGLNVFIPLLLLVLDGIAGH